MDEVKTHALYHIVDEQACWHNAGAVFLGTRGVVNNKGDAIHPEYIPRLVAQPLNRYIRDDLYAATPPFEAFKLLLSPAISQGKREPVPRYDQFKFIVDRRS